MADTDETTKLIVYGLGIGALLFLAYIVYKDFRYDYIHNSQPLERQRQYGFMDSNSSLAQIEQKLIKLEAKIDGLSKTNTQPNIQSNAQTEKTERNIVSMSPSIKSLDIKKNRLDYFGMH